MLALLLVMSIESRLCGETRDQQAGQAIAQVWVNQAQRESGLTYWDQMVKVLEKHKKPCPLKDPPAWTHEVADRLRNNKTYLFPYLSWMSKEVTIYSEREVLGLKLKKRFRGFGFYED